MRYHFIKLAGCGTGTGWFTPLLHVLAAGTGRTGFIPVGPNNYPFYSSDEVYKPVLQSDGGQLSGVLVQPATVATACPTLLVAQLRLCCNSALLRHPLSQQAPFTGSTQPAMTAAQPQPC